jgi:hypothetical protein
LRWHAESVQQRGASRHVRTAVLRVQLTGEVNKPIHACGLHILQSRTRITHARQRRTEASAEETQHKKNTDRVDGEVRGIIEHTDGAVVQSDLALLLVTVLQKARHTDDRATVSLDEKNWHRATQGDGSVF